MGLEYPKTDVDQAPEFYHLRTKAKAVIKVLEDIKKDDVNSKVLIFSEFPNALREVANLLVDIGLEYRMLAAGTGGAKKRGEAIALFQTDPPTRVMLISARSGAVGVTLTAASHVIIMVRLVAGGGGLLLLFCCRESPGRQDVVCILSEPTRPAPAPSPPPPRPPRPPLQEPLLNRSLEEQAIGRSWRMGQDKPVSITRLLVKGEKERAAGGS